MPNQKVKVAVRVRPVIEEGEAVCVSVDNNLVEIFNHRNITETIQYEFTDVFNEVATQQQIYDSCVREMVPLTLQGHNASVFAYGPTGAGKTHTMQGSDNDPGIIPRVVRDLFERISEETSQSNHSKDHNGNRRSSTVPNSKDNTCECSVTFSYLEIYQEKVLDLLTKSSPDLPIREDNHKNIFVTGLSEKKIDGYEDFKQLFDPASSRRTVASTNLNDHSSRSHSIVLLKIDKTVKDADTVKNLRGKFYLIDLAGSEDNKRTGNTGLRLKESGAINKSLFALGEVVDAINNNLMRIPYRNSKLTRLLQDSLGGNSHCMMITNIAPEERFYYDTYCTLNIATKSKKIVNNTHVNKQIAMKHRTKQEMILNHKKSSTSRSNSPSDFTPSTDHPDFIRWIVEQRWTNVPRKSLMGICLACHQVIHDYDSALQCELCQLWYHNECELVSQSVCDVLQRNTVIGLHWYCKNCDHRAAKIVADMVRLENLREEQERRVKELQAGREPRGSIKNISSGDRNVNQHDGSNDKIKGKTSSKTTNAVRVTMSDDREKRKNNLILYNVDESVSKFSNERTLHDVKMFKDVCREIGLEEQMAVIKKCYRIGKQVKTGSPRPLLVQLSSESAVNRALKYAKSLSNCKIARIKKIRFQADLTEAERREQTRRYLQSESETHVVRSRVSVRSINYPSSH